jgi:hypothetical protein
LIAIPAQEKHMQILWVQSLWTLLIQTEPTDYSSVSLDGSKAAITVPYQIGKWHSSNASIATKQ